MKFTFPKIRDRISKNSRHNLIVMSLLFCIGCQQNLDEELFDPKPVYKKLGRTRHFACRECITNRRCRTDEYWDSLLKKHGTICVDCGVPRKLNPEGSCKRCTRSKGFKYCRICKEKRLWPLDFYRGRADCVYCTEISKEAEKERSKKMTPKERAKDRVLFATYKISLEKYNQMAEAQQNLCYICHKPSELRCLAVNHDHKTGKVRKLLCANCNLGLGNFNDDIIALENAIKYLKDHT